MWPFSLNPTLFEIPLVSNALHWLFVASLQSTFVLALAFVATRFTRYTSAAQRHFAWLLAFSALLLLPLLNLTLPNRVIVVQPITASLANRQSLSNSASGPDLINATYASSQFAADDPTPALATPLMASFGWQDAKLLLLSTSPLLISGCWLVGIAVMMLRLIVGLIKLRQLKRHSNPLEMDAWSELTREVSQQIGLRGRIEIRIAHSNNGTLVPLTWGWRRPVILLPAEAIKWSLEKRRAVLLHETAHIGRGDWLVLWFVQCMRAFYWFHPLVWYAARELRTESEAATDDRVLATGFKASSYAECLIEFMNVLGAGRHKSSMLSIGMAHSSTVGKRLTALLDGSRNRRHLTRAQLLGGGTVAAAGFLVLSSLSVADEIVSSTASTQRMVTVKGRILTTQGQPVAGASIVVYNGYGEGQALQKLQSGADGAYTIKVPDSINEYRTIQIEKAGFGVKLANLLPQDAKAPKNWTLGSPVTLSGRVTDEDNVPIANARVAAGYFIENRYYIGQVKGIETQTDAKGQWRLGRLPVGVTSRFSVVAPRYASSEFEVKLEKNAAPYPAVKLQAGFEARGRIIDIDGNPVAGATVIRTNYGYPRSRSDNQGNFVLGGLTARAQKLNISTDLPDQFAPANVVVSPAQPNVQVQLVAGVEVRGRLIDADTLSPIPGVQVENQFRTGGVSVTSDTQGRYKIVLPPTQNFSLTFQKPSYQFRYIFLNEEQMSRSDAGDTTLKRGTIWRGKVRIAGKVPNEMVVLNFESGTTNAQLASDKEGNFQVNALPSGKYKWASALGDWKPLSPIEINIPAAQDTPFVFDVSAARVPRQSARGRVVDQHGHPIAYALVQIESDKDTYGVRTGSDGRWETSRLSVAKKTTLKKVEYKDISRQSLGVPGRRVGEVWQFPDFKLNTQPEQAHVKVLDANGRAASGSRVLALWDSTSVFATTNAQGIAVFQLAPQKVRFLAAKNLNYGEASFDATPRQAVIRLGVPRNRLREAEATVDRLIGSTVNSEISDPAEVIGDERWRLAVLRADGALKAGSTNPDWHRAGDNFGLYLDNTVFNHPDLALQRAPIWLNRIKRSESTKPFFLRLAEANFARLASQSKNANARAWANGWLNRQLAIFDSKVVLKPNWSGGDSVSRYLQGYSVAHNLGRSEASRFMEAVLKELPEDEENSQSYGFGDYFTLNDPNAIRFRSHLVPKDQVNFQGTLGAAAVRANPKAAPQASAALEALLKEPAIAEVEESIKRFARQRISSETLSAEIKSLRQRSAHSTPQAAFEKLKAFNYANEYNLSGFALSLARRALERGDKKLTRQIIDFTVTKKWDQDSLVEEWAEFKEQYAPRPGAIQIQQWRVEAIANLKNGDLSLGKDNVVPDLTVDSRRLRPVDPALGRLILEAKWLKLGPLGVNPNLDNRYDAIRIAKIMGQYDAARAFELFQRIPRGGDSDPKGDELTFAMRVIAAARKPKNFAPS